MRVVVDNGPGRKRHASSSRSLKSAQPHIVLRAAVAADALALHGLIASHLEEGRLLPRTLDSSHHAPFFVRRGDEIVVARSSRRCRRRSPKCDRWSSAAMLVVSVSASAWSRSWRFAPVAKATAA